MKVAYVTMFDATDIRNWSGTDLHIWKALEGQGITIELIGNLQHGRSIGRKMRNLWSKHLERKEVLHFWDVATARDYAQDVQRRLESMDADVVLSPTPVPLAFLDCPQLKCLWTDATYSALSRDYWEFDERRVSLPAASNARRIDKAVFQNCDLALFASEWGLKWAVHAGGARPDDTFVVPFGANLAIHHGATEAVGFARTRKASPLQLLFVGVDWVRKGASKAIEVVKQVRAMGLQAELTIVGCQPPAESTIPHYVKIRGFISKSTEEGRNELLQLYRESHFLVVPTTAEAYGLVFAEASAFGVPSISHRVGGVTTVVQDELNGRLFEMQAPVQAWAEWIVETVSRSGRLEELAATSFDEYQSRLNWKVAGRRVATLLSDRCRLHTGTQGVIVSG